MERMPIDEVLPDLLRALERGGNAVLVAEPGAGKTTRVPLSIMEQSWLAGKRIIMLEPRRLAARSAAGYMASLLGEKAGERVGYRVRLDSKVSSKTVIEVVTEGVLTRMLQSDPALEGVGAVLFDEFHERHLHGDLGLALCLQTQSLLREDLRMVVMSATLDAEPVARLLGDAPVFQSTGRAYPVETRYRAAKSSGPIEPQVGETVLQALREETGDMLVFLPGVPEIKRTVRWLHEKGLPGGIKVRELHGGMTLEEQSSAVAKCAAHERKVVLATSVAESSLTVEGVKIVVDGGLARTLRFSPRTGLSRLETVPVSKASADQRRGRAGRLAPGVCYRIWTEEEQAYLPDQGKPEVLEADLSALALELAVWGVRDPEELEWLTPPPPSSIAQANALLRLLKALDEQGRPTADGIQIARLGLHPRLGAMLLAAAKTSQSRLACELAALLSERDLLPGEKNVDLSLRLSVLHKGSPGHVESISRIQKQAAQWERMLHEGMKGSGGGDERQSSASQKQQALGSLLATAYPDRIAQRRADGRYVLSGGRGAVLPELQPLSRFPYLVVCELDDSGKEATIRSGAEIAPAELERQLASQIQTEDSVEWDAGTQSVRARRRLKLGALTLSDKPQEGTDPEAVAEVWLKTIRETGFRMIPLSKSAQTLLLRMRLMALSGDPDWPDVTEEGLLNRLEHWLKPHLYGVKNMAEFQKLPWAQIIGGEMSWKQSQVLEDEVPTHITVPSGSRLPVDYSDPVSPVLAVRLQELFGLKETPKLANGRLPVTLHLLSPSQRPVQVTRDLASFWETAYFEVKKDLKGRYPKHYWPDNPYEAVATNRVRPKPQS
ncbi:ATP-dependent helicase HrpB [Paenibacillus sp. M.A.Huq-81]